MGELYDRHRQVMQNWIAVYYDEPLEIVKQYRAAGHRRRRAGATSTSSAAS